MINENVYRQKLNEIKKKTVSDIDNNNIVIVDLIF